MQVRERRRQASIVRDGGGFLSSIPKYGLVGFIGRLEAADSPRSRLDWPRPSAM